MNNALIHTYLDGEMSEDKSAEIRASIETHPNLKTSLVCMQKIIQEVKKLPVEKPSADFSDKVMRQITQPHLDAAGKASSLNKFKNFQLRARGMKWTITSLAAVAAAITIILTITISRLPDPQTGKTSITAGRGERISDSKTTGVVYVNFILYMPEANEISLCGDFNDWKLNQIKLIKSNNTGLWSTTVPLPANQAYQYTFVVDGHQWIADPAASAFVDDGFGSRNSVLDLRNM